MLFIRPGRESLDFFSNVPVLPQPGASKPADPPKRPIYDKTSEQELDEYLKLKAMPLG